MRSECTFFVWKPEGMARIGNLGVGGRIILK
jgi:hypothetical protein